eukprot:UN04900
MNLLLNKKPTIIVLPKRDNIVGLNKKIHLKYYA